MVSSFCIDKISSSCYFRFHIYNIVNEHEQIYLYDSNSVIRSIRKTDSVFLMGQSDPLKNGLYCIHEDNFMEEFKNIFPLDLLKIITSYMGDTRYYRLVRSEKLKYNSMCRYKYVKIMSWKTNDIVYYIRNSVNGVVGKDDLKWEFITQDDFNDIVYEKLFNPIMA